MKKIKTILSDSKTEVVESEKDSYITDEAFESLEGCVPMSESDIELVKQHPAFRNAQWKTLTIELADDCIEGGFEKGI